MTSVETGRSWNKAAATLGRQALEAGAVLEATATTSSMSPLIRPGDRVFFRALPPEGPRLGDIVLALTVRGDLCCHRVVGLSTSTVTIQGDACLTPDPPLTRKDIVALAISVRRRGRTLDLTSQAGCLHGLWAVATARIIGGRLGSLANRLGTGLWWSWRALMTPRRERA